MRIGPLIWASIVATAAHGRPTAAQNNTAIEVDEALLRKFCNRPGNPCYILSKAQAAAAEHLNKPEVKNSTESVECYKQGNACQVAKRSAEALAVAVASVDLEPKKRRYCDLMGEPCAKVQKLDTPERLSRRLAEPVAGPKPVRFRFCHLWGEPCIKRRDAASTAATRRSKQLKPRSLLKRWWIWDGPPPADLGFGPQHPKFRFCHLMGEPCIKVKRAVEAIDTALNHNEAREAGLESTSSQLKRRCNQVGAPCEKARRSAEALRIAAANALSSAGL